MSSHASAPACVRASAYDRATTAESFTSSRQGAVMPRFAASREHAPNAPYWDEALQPHTLAAVALSCAT